MKKLLVFKNNRFIGDWAYGQKSKPYKLGEAPQCTACGICIGMKEWLPPFRIILKRGVKTIEPGDAIFGVFDDFIASQSFRDSWEREKLKGIIEWRQVEIISRRKIKMKYYYPRLKEPTAKPDLKKMKVIWSKAGPPICKVCYGADKDAIKGIYLLKGSVPQDDLFHFLGDPSLLASERFKNIVEKDGLTNITFIPAKEYKWDPLRKLE